MHKRSTVVLRLAGLLAAVALMGPSTGWAEPGDGLKAGDLKLHPRLELSGVYDTNLFRQAVGEGRGLQPAPALFITPGMNIETVDPTMFDFEFDGDLTWEQYFGSGVGISEQSGLTGKGYIGGTINPKGTVSFKLENDFKHVSEAPYYPRAPEYNWFRNRAGAVFGIHPGDDILEINAGYHWNLYQYYFNSALDLDKQEHEVDLDLRWKFLPKTAYVLEGDFSAIRYETPTRGVEGAGLPNVDSMPVGFKTGLSGLITRRLTAKLLGGWAWGLYESGPTYSGPIGRAQLAYQYGQIPLNNRIRIFYERRFEDSSVSNYAGVHEVGGGVQQRFFDKRLKLNAEVRYLNREFSNLQAEKVTINGQTYKRVRNFKNQDVFLPDDMHDQLLNVGAGVEGELTKWWTLGVSYEYWQNFTNDQVDIPQENVTSLRTFQQHLIMLNTAIKY